MQRSQQKKIGFSIIFIFFMIILLIFWLKPQTLDHKNMISKAEASHDTLANKNSGANAKSPQINPFMSSSQQDTQVNCQIRIDHSNHLIVNEQTKDCFEYFITQYGEKDIEAIQASFLAYTKASYTEPVLSQLIELWSRYLDYRQALATLKPPNVSQDSANYYQMILNSVSNLRKQFFSEYEIQGLFGTSDQYDQYTINRMKILDDQRLSEIEKAQKLKALFDQLPEDWKENLKELSKLEDLRKLSSDIKARGGSAQELHQMRVNLVGQAATQRLENLDVQRADWDSRINHYLNARDSILESGMSDVAQQQAITQLKNNQFKNQQEQLRLQTFETTHDQGGNLSSLRGE